MLGPDWPRCRALAKKAPLGFRPPRSVGPRQAGIQELFRVADLHREAAYTFRTKPSGIDTPQLLISVFLVYHLLAQFYVSFLFREAFVTWYHVYFDSILVFLTLMFVIFYLYTVQ